MKLKRLAASAAVLLATTVGIAIGWGYALIMFLGILSMVMVHEAGHFIGARVGGIAVTEFFVGFGPRVASFHRNGVEYGVKALPLGGYVRIIGMTADEKIPDHIPESATYRAASYPRKVLAVVAGPMVNILTTVVIFIALFAFHGVWTPSTTVDSVLDGSPAAQAGITPGDKLVSVSGTAVRSHAELREVVSTFAPNAAVQVTVQRGESTQDLSVVLADGKLGYYPQQELVRQGFVGSVHEGSLMAWQTLKVSVSALGTFASQATDLVAGLDEPETIAPEARPSSVIGISHLGGEAIEQGGITVWLLAASVSMFLGIVNLLPFLPLDGGHLAVATYERLGTLILRRPTRIPARLMGYAALAALVPLLGFGAIGAYLDIVDPLSLTR